MSGPEHAEPVSRGLVAKLCAAGAAIGWIEKSGRNAFHNYAYATEADLVAALRGELYKRNVFVFPCVLQQERKPITVSSRNGDRQTALTDVMIRWTFVDGETGERFECDVPGCGEDSGDKGIYKAMTGSEKYLLMKAFLIPTGDDPEKDGPEERKEAFQNGKEAAQAVAQRKIAEAGSRVNPKEFVSSTREAFEMGAKSSATAAEGAVPSLEGKGAALKIVQFHSETISREWKTRTHDWQRLSGTGMAQLLATLEKTDPHFKSEFIYYDEAEMYWYVLKIKADILADIVVSAGMDAKQTVSGPALVERAIDDGAAIRTQTGTPKSQDLRQTESLRRHAQDSSRRTEGAAISTDVQPQHFPTITILRASPKALWLTWGEIECSCPNKHLWPYLTDGSGKPADLIVQQGSINPKTQSPFINVTGIRKIGETTFSDNVPDLQQGLR
jgi:hypothetical protein